MTKKSTVIVPMTLLAALAAGVVVHDRLVTDVDDTVPTQTASTATAEPAASRPVSLPPVADPGPTSQEASRVEDAAPAQTASIGTAGPAAPTPVTVQPFSAAPPGTPGIEPPPRMTASQEANLNAWMIKTYLTCWNQAAQPGHANRLSRGCASNSNPTDRSWRRRSSSIRRPIRRRSHRQRACCKLSRHATRYLCRLNIAPSMSNGRPRPSCSIRRSLPAPGHEPACGSAGYTGQSTGLPNPQARMRRSSISGRLPRLSLVGGAGN
jgi:hypothetical protein